MSLFRKIKKHVSRLGMYLDQSSNFSYAQEGEDRILLRYFENKADGFYIDVGAHHPKLYSNTYLFYKKNWHGINIDAMPGSMIPFQNSRTRDTNIEAAISDQEQELSFHIFSDPALNTFDPVLAAQRINPVKKHSLQKKLTLHTTTLTKVLDQYLPPQQEIDFLSVDIEGYDLQALRSLDLNRYRPHLILVEIYEQQWEQAEIYRFLKVNRYSLMAKSVLTCIFKDDQR